MNNMKISIVIPIYNTKEYLRECFDSIINQTYKNLEIILIDDGSTDGSSEICDNYAQKDSRIVVVHKKNEGVAVARNTGIGIATGDYIAFVDSDDFIDLRMFERLANNAKKHNADISMCNFKTTLDSSGSTEYLNEVPLDSGRTLKHLYVDMDICFVVFWAKIYKRSLFDGITIPSVACAEDNHVLYKLFLKTNSIVFDKSKLYVYRYRENSATKTFDESSAEDFRAFNEQMLLWEKCNRADLHRMCFVRAFKRLVMTMDCARSARKIDGFDEMMKAAYNSFRDTHIEKVKIGPIEKRMYKTDWFDGKSHKVPFYYVRVKELIRNYRFLKKYSLR
ncbi:MAG: glycosyltransferase [Clostridia bacterium]|nr:glycosyltransferase [Clostridia bacterium]